MRPIATEGARLMKLLSYGVRGGVRPAALLASDDESLEIVDLRECAHALDSRLDPADFRRLAKARDIGEVAGVSRAGMQQLAKFLASRSVAQYRKTIPRARLLAPIATPRRNIFCVGRNYLEHVREGDLKRGIQTPIPEHPQFFTKPPSAVIGDGAAIEVEPQVSTQIDYEVELGVVIGHPVRNIGVSEAMSSVLGFTIINDVTARDLQRRHDQWFKGKGLDTFCPLGPWVVTADEIVDPHALGLELRVNGELRQSDTTAHMHFRIERLIADLSRGMTLLPGDVIATGTPPGVGYAMTPPRFLVPGDEVRCSIEGIGSLSNPVRLRPQS